MRPAPDALQVVSAHIPLLVQVPVEFGGVMSLGMDLGDRRRRRPILVRGTSDFLARTLFQDAREVAPSRVIVIWSSCYHGHSRRRGRWRSKHTWLKELGWGRTTELGRSVAVNNLTVRSAEHSAGLLGSGFRCFSRFGGAGPLLPGKVGFGEALFARLGLPIVVPDPPAIDDHPTPELTEHAPGRDNRDLPGAVRERQYFLLHQMILFHLVSDDFV